MATVSIQGVSKEYRVNRKRVHALDNVTLEIKDGEFICVVGHSGCGKTTLLNILAGFIEPTLGRVVVGEKVQTANPDDIGVVFQEYALFPWRTALENVEFGLEMIGMAKDERRKTAKHFLELVHLTQAEDVYPHHLSGGMRQRVAVARALAYAPALLLMDEPFGALDTQTRERLQSLTEEIWLKTHKTIFYVTHNLSEAVYLADRIVVMRPNPGHIHEIIQIPLSRPRDTLSPEFVSIQRYITHLIKEDAPGDDHEQ